MVQNPKYEMFVLALLDGKSASQAAEISKIHLTERSNIRGYGVYFLVDPRDGHIFYVGKGKGYRPANHLTEWRLGKCQNSRKRARIGRIVDAGLVPRVVILDECLGEEKAIALERLMIDSIGLKNLTNLVTSGYNPFVREAARVIRFLRYEFKWPHHFVGGHGPHSEAGKVMYKQIVKELLELHQWCIQRSGKRGSDAAA